MFLKIKNLINKFEKFLWSKAAYKFYLSDLKHVNDLEKASIFYNTLIFSSKIKPILCDPPKNKRITVIAPHPDDEVIGPGATLIQSTKNNSEIEIIYLTSGKKEDIGVRESEAKTLCKKLGWKRKFLRNEPEKETWNSNEFIISLNKSKPEKLMLPFVLDDNKDHKFANKILLEIFDKLDKKIFSKTEVWAYQVYTAVFPNVVVDITDLKNKKIDFINIYKSQMKSRNWVNFTLGLNAWNSRWLNTKGAPGWAESFFVISFKDYIELLKKYY